MSHPFKDKAKDGKATAKARGYASGGSVPNKAMTGAYKKVDGSSSSMQHKDQAAAPGRAMGGAVKYPLKKGGSESGVGRLEKAKK